MKRTLTILALFAAALMLTACGNNKTINGKDIETYGIANMESKQDPTVVYEISAGSVICAILFSETVIVPVYVIGWDLWQPVKAAPVPAK